MHSLTARECRSRGRGSATSEAAYLPAVLPYLPTCLPPNFLKDFSMFISSTYRRSASASPPLRLRHSEEASRGGSGLRPTGAERRRNSVRMLRYRSHHSDGIWQYDFLEGDVSNHSKARTWSGTRPDSFHVLVGFLESEAMSNITSARRGTAGRAGRMWHAHPLRQRSEFLLPGFAPARPTHAGQ